jgi:L-alanine-DL-glutamate epimerase-like enolase superfamily enzyme
MMCPRSTLQKGSMNRRTLLKLAGTAPLSRGLTRAAEAKRQIKIKGIETDLLRLPPGEFTGDAIHDFGSAAGGVVLRLLTNAGITGWGYSNFGMIEGGPRVVQTILEYEIKPVLIGQDPAFPKRIRADLWRALEYQGVQGITQFAMSLVDIAVWDILGKAAGLPVYKMLGAVRDRMPVYAMCGWYRENDRDHSQYKRTIDETLEIGYRAFKVKVGRYSLEDDAERIEFGRKVAGKDIRILVDANQAFNRAEALRRGRVYQEMGCFWYEEPLPPWDHEGYAELASSWTCVSLAAKTNTTSTLSWIFCSRKASTWSSQTIAVPAAPPSGLRLGLSRMALPLNWQAMAEGRST